MIATRAAFDSPNLISGMSIVDTSALAWPGTTFSISDSAGAAQVESSYKLLAGSIGCDRHLIATVRQVHGSNIVRVSDTTAIDQVRNSCADGLLTTVPGILLGVKLADCCGVLLHDPVRGVVAAVHSGWRGTAANITGAMIDRLVGEVGCDVSNIHAWLSPCASGQAYEVGADVADVLSEFCTPTSDALRSDSPPIAPPIEPKWYFDNHRAIVHQLVARGVPEDNISVDRACTIGDVRYHSFRRDAGRSGRMLAFIGMREKP
ncbi:MAG: polyphenol oxidase family protein [Candidatus Kapabacteria bacterium]|nr:polyphenol oxidase family protein [Candidatus Kapabacteria bacterium]